MNRLTAAALVLAAFIVGCGVGAEEEGGVPMGPVNSGGSLNASGPAVPEPQQQQKWDLVPVAVSRPETLAAPLLVVKGHSFDAVDGQKVTVLSGILGCGWMETGRAEGIFEEGAFTAPLTRHYEDFGYESLFVFIDRDADGVCDVEKGDGLFQAAYSKSGHVVSVDATQLEPTSGWECMLFEHAEPAP